MRFLREMCGYLCAITALRLQLTPTSYRTCAVRVDPVVNAQIVRGASRSPDYLAAHGVTRYGSAGCACASWHDHGSPRSARPNGAQRVRITTTTDVDSCHADEAGWPRRAPASRPTGRRYGRSR